MQEPTDERLRQAFQTRTQNQPAPPERLKDRLDVVRRVLTRHPLVGPGDAVLVIHHGSAERVVELRGDMTIGAAPDCETHVVADYVSRRHCRLSRDQQDWLVEDLGSTNGTFVNGDRTARRLLRDGDVLQIGALTAFFFRRCHEDAAAAKGSAPVPCP